MRKNLTELEQSSQFRPFQALLLSSAIKFHRFQHTIGSYFNRDIAKLLDDDGAADREH